MDHILRLDHKIRFLSILIRCLIFVTIVLNASEIFYSFFIVIANLLYQINHMIFWLYLEDKYEALNNHKTSGGTNGGNKRPLHIKDNLQGKTGSSEKNVTKSASKNTRSQEENKKGKDGKGQWLINTWLLERHKYFKLLCLKYLLY